MSNTATVCLSMPGLWKEDAFWGFFSHDPKRLSKLEVTGTKWETVRGSAFLKNVRKYISEDRLRELVKEEYLNGRKPYPPIECIFKNAEPDSVTTIARYSCDLRLAQALANIFPDREIRCSWFIDGLGDYGSFTFLGRETRDEMFGNLQEDLERFENT